MSTVKIRLKIFVTNLILLNLRCSQLSNTSVVHFSNIIRPSCHSQWPSCPWTSRPPFPGPARPPRPAPRGPTCPPRYGPQGGWWGAPCARTLPCNACTCRASPRCARAGDDAGRCLSGSPCRRSCRCMGAHYGGPEDEPAWIAIIDSLLIIIERERLFILEVELWFKCTYKLEHCHKHDPLSYV